MRRTIVTLSLLGLAGLASCGGDNVMKQASPTVAARPMLIAHRGGTADFPENTLPAIENALAQRVDGIWLTVQLSKDGVPVLYRPMNLAELTNSTGPVSDKTAEELARVNAGWSFKRIDANGRVSYPYREASVGIPTLEQALRTIPPNVLVFLDMKALPAAPQATAVAQVLNAENAWPRVVLYSTESAYQAEFSHYSHARLFESRDQTRKRLFEVALANRCAPPPPGAWTGFELDRNVDVVEHFTLGEGQTNVTARTWTASSVACFRQSPQVKVVAFGVNTTDAYRRATCLGVDAVMVDSPRTMRHVADAAGAFANCSDNAATGR
ncbi:glycerophosphodiester phosphodiesterase family protein [Burkholderia pyrrocinia]